MHLDALDANTDVVRRPLNRLQFGHDRLHDLLADGFGYGHLVLIRFARFEHERGKRLDASASEAGNLIAEFVAKDVADVADVPLVPFFLEGVGGQSQLMQADGIHPNAQAQPQLLENAWPVLKPLL